MLDQPEHWRRYYAGTAEDQAIARRYSYSDRMRYYWPDPEIQAAERGLLAVLSGRTIPLPLLSQYLPDVVNHLTPDGRLPDENEMSGRL